jgi:site-specific DNA-methyltransferase (adenine-specific)
VTPYYQDELTTLYHCDCRELTVTDIGHVDCTITDPPYDAETHAGARTNAASAADKKLVINFDPADPFALAPWLTQFAERWTVAFCSMEMLGDYRRATGDAWMRAGFWRRTNGMPQISGDRPGQPGEGIAIWHKPLSAGRVGSAHWNGGGKHAFYEHAVSSGAWRVHPTQKPDGLMMAVIRDFTDPGEIIFDPFAGSCTTLVIAKQLGRRAVGVEIGEKWCRLGVERLGQGALPF